MRFPVSVMGCGVDAGVFEDLPTVDAATLIPRTRAALLIRSPRLPDSPASEVLTIPRVAGLVEQCLLVATPIARPMWRVLARPFVVAVGGLAGTHRRGVAFRLGERFSLLPVGLLTSLQSRAVHGERNVSFDRSARLQRSGVTVRA